MQYRAIPLVAFVCMAISSSVLSDEAGISFSAAREIILAHNPGLLAAGTKIESAHYGVKQSGVFQNPGIGVTLDKFGANEIEATVEQTIELGNKRRIRTEFSEKQVEAVTNMRNLTLLELEAEIVRRFIPISASSQKILLLDSIIEIAELAKNQIQMRVEAGAARKTDLIRAEIDIEQLKLKRNETVRESEQSRKKFAALGGKEYLTLLNVSGTVSGELTFPSLDEFLKALGNHPQLKAFDIDKKQMEYQQELLKTEVTPDLNISAGYLRNNTENTNSPIVGVSMSVPMFNKNTAAKKQVALMGKASREQRDNTANLLDADIRDLYSSIEEIDKSIAALRTTTIPKALQVFSIMQEYYSAGNAGFLELADAQSEMLMLRMDLLDLQTEQAQNLANLMQTTSLNIQIVK